MATIKLNKSLADKNTIRVTREMNDYGTTMGETTSNRGKFD